MGEGLRNSRRERERKGRRIALEEKKASAGVFVGLYLNNASLKKKSNSFTGRLLYISLQRLLDRTVSDSGTYPQQECSSDNKTEGKFLLHFFFFLFAVLSSPLSLFLAVY